MLHQPILTPPKASRKTWPRAFDWRVGTVATAGLLTTALMLWLAGDLRFALGFLASFAALASLILLLPRSTRDIGEASAGPEQDVALLAATLDEAMGGIAVTDRAGRLVAANDAYQALFAGAPAPRQLATSAVHAEAFDVAARTAWRDGTGTGDVSDLHGGNFGVAVRRVGARADHLLWRFTPRDASPALGAARLLTEGSAATLLAKAGIGIALVDAGGRVIGAGTPLTRRSARIGGDFAALLTQDDDSRLRYAADGPGGPTLRVVQLATAEPARRGADPGATADPPAAPAAEPPSLFVLIEEHGEGANGPLGSAVNLQALLQILPLGLALVADDGRFLFFNDAYRAAAGFARGDKPVYPSDLVVKEDKAAVSDAVRRFARGAGGGGGGGGGSGAGARPHLSGDIAVRLKSQPAEPVALTIAGTRGLGEAAVLLLLKDNSEEVRLKAQVAQATKMQAVGQLAGGVAHDFNNILTAIIGHCDLMMMRHTPGDSDYDDIQQIKNNGNRAAALTRQLLAFSRQQTLRPQVLQLPDVISEVSHLLKRLLGDEVKLVVKHGRNLGAVRADPGQLEQVIINLAVNARDAMAARPDDERHEAGTLTIQTYPVTADEVRTLGSEILPVADYTALSVADTGSGIPAGVLGKIFEPFFTTKEVGKGTGLGLSTVYGIVKQSGGFIFADSVEGEGTTFTIYLPVHDVEERTDTPIAPPSKPDELWGRGVVLLVEDEAMVRAVAERALTRQGYTVLTATNGEEALERLESGEAIDLLVSDVVMPAMDGPTMVRAARILRPDIPVLFMSGYAEEQLRQSIDIEHAHFLPKPFSVQQLAEAARDALAHVAP